MIKRALPLLLISLLILNIFLMLPISAQEPDSNFEVDTSISTLTGFDMDPNTGLPVEFGKFKEIGNQLSEEEQRKDYIKQEWTKLLSQNKFFGPILYYTNNFFSFFNPLWNLIFKISFAWSWAFILSLIIWIIIIVLSYTPIKYVFRMNQILSLIASFIIATLVGVSGGIKQGIEILTLSIPNFWMLLIIITILIFLSIIYSKTIKQYAEKAAKEAEEDKTKRAQQIIQAHAEVSKKALGLKK